MPFEVVDADALQTRHHQPASADTTGIGYPKWIGHKFDANGHALPFCGNTILSQIDKDGQFFAALSEIHKELSRWPHVSSFALLPSSSYHVTLMQGVCDSIREPSNWPRDLPLTSELIECNSHFMGKLKQLSGRLSLDHPIRMRIVGWRPLDNNIGLRLVPATVQEKKRLSGFRDALADELQLRLPGHDEYEFHVTMAYSLRLFNDAECQKILTFLESLLSTFPEIVEIGPPEFCVFEDMLKYVALYCLGS